MKIGGAVGVEVEDLGGIGREREAMLPGPDADLGAAALQDGDVERIDAHLLEDLRARMRRAPADPKKEELRWRWVGLAHEALQGPVSPANDAGSECRAAG